MMKTRQTIENALLQYLQSEVFDDAIPLTAETDLLAAGFDSLALLKLIHHIEESMGVRIPESEITEARIASVEALSELIHSLQKDETTSA